MPQGEAGGNRLTGGGISMDSIKAPSARAGSIWPPQLVGLALAIAGMLAGSLLTRPPAHAGSAHDQAHPHGSHHAHHPTPGHGA